MRSAVAWERVARASAVAAHEQSAERVGARAVRVNALGLPLPPRRRLDRREARAGKPVRVRWRCLSCGHESLGRTLGPADIGRLVCSGCGCRGQVAQYSVAASAPVPRRVPPAAHVPVSSR